MHTTNSSASGAGSCDLTPETLYHFLVSMKSSIQTARTRIIRRHTRLIVRLKATIKNASSNDDQKGLSASALKNKRKATKLKYEVKTLKTLTEHDIGKLVLLNTKTFNTAANEGASAAVSAICRMAEHEAIVAQKQRFSSHFGESVTQLPFCVKVLGAEKQSKRMRKLQADKKGRALEYERRLCKLLKEIGGEEFAAAERLYVKVLSMKKSLQKRKKTEKAWANAQGPLGDRKAAYEEYLKTVKEGEEKETFASYVEKMNAEGNNDSVSESDDDDDNTSMKNSDSSEDEGADPKQLELRKKIFENLDAKFGEWNDEDDSDISDVDDVEVTPGEFKCKSNNSIPTPSRGQPAKPKFDNKTASLLQKSSLSLNKINTKKRKRDANNSDVEGSNVFSNAGSELSGSIAGGEVRQSRRSIPDTTAGSRVPERPAYADRADDKTRSSLFSLFKQTTLATKKLAPPDLKKPKDREPLDKNTKKSLYCGEKELIPSSGFLTTSATNVSTSFLQGDEEKSVTSLNKLFVGNKKKIVSENEAELSEIPESIAYEKAQKMNRAGLAAECASDDEQEDLAGFNSNFLLKHEGQSLLQHMSLRGGKRSRGRGADARGRGSDYRRGGLSRSGGGDDERFLGVGGDDKDSGGRKFGSAFFSRGRSEGEKRGRGGNRASALRPPNSRFENDGESLHPSWAAKRLNSGALAEFKGKRTVFN